jgi:hypothetical protein
MEDRAAVPMACRNLLIYNKYQAAAKLTYIRG